MKEYSCGELTASDIGKKVKLAGWVHTIRDHGNIIFVDLRDWKGITQVVVKKDDVGDEKYDELGRLPRESVIEIEGKVTERPKGTENEDLKTGEIEVSNCDFKILTKCAQTLPFHWADVTEPTKESLRLKYRYIDLRSPRYQRNMRLRSKWLKETYDYLDEQGFLHIETPYLTKSTPEGARDYIVPSRIHQGKFYALPQSPQLFKQILMVSGVEKYFQFARCFRDEDLRVDRQPEFTQLDMEMSFVEQDDILNIIEGLLKHVFKETLSVDLETPFPRLSYEEAINRYGVDKPDTRFGMELQDLTEVIPDDVSIFKKVFENNGIIKGIKVNNYGDISNSQFKRLRNYVINDFKVKDLGSIMLREDEIKTPLSRFTSQEVIDDIIDNMSAEKGDLILFIGGDEEKVHQALGELRLKLAKERDLIPKDKFNFLWVVDFPLFEYNYDEQRWTAMHHPFTSCKKEFLDNFDTDPGNALANAYDIVLNGYEIGGGSIRIHDLDVQRRMFNTLGLSDEEVEVNFKFLMGAFRYGAPPHGGIALGIDRILMLMTDEESIRDVIAFPKNRNAQLPIGDAPSPISKEQLDVLGIELKEEVMVELNKEKEKKKS